MVAIGVVLGPNGKPVLDDNHNDRFPLTLVFYIAEFFDAGRGPYPPRQISSICSIPVDPTARGEA
jgi:hypothetical protein